MSTAVPESPLRIRRIVRFVLLREREREREENKIKRRTRVRRTKKKMKNERGGIRKKKYEERARRNTKKKIMKNEGEREGQSPLCAHSWFSFSLSLSFSASFSLPLYLSPLPRAHTHTHTVADAHTGPAFFTRLHPPTSQPQLTLPTPVSSVRSTIRPSAGMSARLSVGMSVILFPLARPSVYSTCSSILLYVWKVLWSFIHSSVLLCTFFYSFVRSIYPQGRSSVFCVRSSKI